MRDILADAEIVTGLASGTSSPVGTRRWSRWMPVVAVLAAMALVVLLGGDAAACPTCKDGVAEADPEGMNVARGYFYSILLMLGMPFTLAGTFGVYVWREMRRQERERLRAGQGGTPVAVLPVAGAAARGA
mgnify:CR=1 FL=1